MATKSINNLWGLVLARGIAAILFGIAAVFWPGITLVTLVYLFSSLILISGVISMIAGLSSNMPGTSKVLTMVLSLLEIGVGVYLLRHPQVTFTTLILLIGLVLVVRGLFDTIGGLFDGKAGSKFLTIIAGIFTVLAGLIVLFQPVSSGVAFVWILGLWALISGPFLIAMSLDMKSLNDKRA